jgi:NAD(P)-dependent dehydrogenase (short-subunit alcohol dehydrogenase family)
MRLQGKIAVVTGGSSGIGPAIAERFAQEGSRVFIVGRRQSELDKATNLLGNSVQAIQGDITVTEDLDRLYGTLQQQAGKLDILVANSGMADSLSIDKITEDHFDKTFDLKLALRFSLCRRRFR